MWRRQASSYGRPMTTTHTEPIDTELAERLADSLHRAFETFEGSPDDFADDLFADLLPPLWRFQMEGRDAFLGQLRAITGAGSTVRPLRVVPTPTGFVTEHEHTHPVAGDVEVARRLILCEVRDGRIAEITVYCNGGWDRELRARHAAQAPMLRP
jgi:hypothetical protein